MSSLALLPRSDTDFFAAGLGAALARAVAPARLAAAGLLVVFVGLFALPLQAQAQTVTTFVSNTAQGSGGASNHFQAQRFATGTNTGGYTISEVQVRLNTTASRSTSVKIRKNNATNKPGDLVATLTNPGTLTGGSENTFTAPPDTTLDASTNYWISVNEGITIAGDRASVARTTSDVETGETGWSIDNTRLTRSSETAGWSTNSQGPLVIAVKGTANPTTTSSDATLSALTLSKGTLSPTFSSDVTTYTASVGDSVSRIKVTGTAADDANASVAYLDVDGNPLTDVGAADGHQVDLDVGDNVIQVQVTAEDTTTETYTVTVTRAEFACTAPDLSGRLEVWTATMTVGLGEDGDYFGYSLSESAGTLSDRTIDYRGNNYTIYDVKHYPGDFLEISLNNSIPAVDRARLRLHVCGDTFDLASADDQTGDYFSWDDGNYFWSTGITVSLALSANASSDATLSALALSDGELSPSFASNVIDYTASAANAASRITVTAARSDAAADIDYLDGDGDELTDLDLGTDGHQVDLVVGENVIQVKLTAEDGATTKTYKVTVTRAAGVSTDATLSALTLSKGTLSPAFASDVIAYAASVGDSVSRITVTAARSDSDAGIAYLDGDDIELADLDTVADGHQVDLVVGANTIKVKVTAGDGTTTKTYTVTVTRAAQSDTDANLSAIALAHDNGAAIALSPAFASNVIDYTASVPRSAGEITITVATRDSAATVEDRIVDNNNDEFDDSTKVGDVYPFQVRLDSGDNVIQFKVTAGDGTTTKTYTVTVSVSGTDFACTSPDLSGRTEVWTGTLTVGSDSDLYGYSSPSSYGELSDTSFDYAGNSYSFLEIRVYNISGIDLLEIELNRSFPGLDLNKLRLHVCGDTFDLASALYSPPPGHTYVWHPVPEWSHATTIEMALTADNVAPVFEDGATASRGFDEDLDPGEPFGTPVIATDDEMLVYSLEGTDAALFDIGADGVLLTRAGESYDHETKSSYEITVKADDGKGETATIAVTVNVGDVDEPPEAPAEPTVTPVAGSTTSLSVTWTEPSNKGPAIDGYDLRYRVTGTSGWTDGPEDVTATTETLTGLAEGTSYGVQVLATNAEGDGAWSVEGTGRTGANTPATGQPAISGTAQVGQTLTAGIGDIADAEDLPSTVFPAGYTFQWVRVDSSNNETDVGTDSTYSPTSSDVGSTIKVEVSFTDNADNAETVTSDATAVVTVASSCAEVWCATLTVQSFSGNRGCANSVSGKECSNTSHLTEDEFTHVGTGYAVTSVQVRSDGELRLFLNPNLTTASQSLVLLVGAERFAFAHADTKSGNYRYWDSSGLSWSSGAPVELKLVEASTIATLSDLEIEDGAGAEVELTPEFSSGTTPYTASVANSVSRITLTETPSNANAWVDYLDGAGTALTDLDTGTTGHQVDLDLGDNVIQVKVTAEDGVATQTYTVTVTREAGQPVTVSIAAEYARIGAGLEDLVFTLTREGAATDALEATVTIVQAESWLGNSDLSHTVTFAAGSPTATLPLAASLFSFEPDTSGDLTATVAVAGVSSGSATVEMVSTADPAITVSYDMSSYTFAEDATDVEIYVVATLDPAYPRAPRSFFIAVSTKSGTATLILDYVEVNVQAEFVHGDFASDGNRFEARKRLQTNAGTYFAVENDDVYEGSERFVVYIERSPGLLSGLVQFVRPNGDICEALSCSPRVEYPVTITDEEDRPVLSLAADPASITEEDDDTTTSVTENVSVLTVSAASPKTFATDQAITLTFAGSAVYGTHYSVSPVDTDANAAGHQAVLPAETASVQVTVTATTNDTADGDRSILVTGSRDGTAFGTATTITLLDDETTNTAPTVSTVAITSMAASDNTYGTGEMIQFTVTFDQDVTVVGTPEFEFCLGTTSTVSCDMGPSPPARRRAALSSGSGTTALVFSYTVVAGDMDDNGIWIGDQSRTIKLEGGTIQGTVGELDAVLTHDEVGAKTGHKVNGATANTVATGKPGISGTAAVGQTLTATTSGITDADGKTKAENDDSGYAYTYQWILVDGNTETDISGETLSTYTPSSSDVGKTIKVRVSFTDDLDNAEDPLTSDATAVVTVVTVDVSIAADHDRIGAGLEDLVFTLTRQGATTAELEATVTIVQDRSWLSNSDLSHTVTFTADSATATLTLAARNFSFDPDTSDDLTATVTGTGIAGGEATVEMVSTADPPITISYDMSSYTFAEDAADVEIYMVATLDPAYPRAPSRSFETAFLSNSDTATSLEDYRSFSFDTEFVHEDYEFNVNSNRFVARKRLQYNNGANFDVEDDEVYEGPERLVLIIQRSPSLPSGLVQFARPNGDTCVPLSCSTTVEYPVIITDEEDRPVLSLSADPASITEEDDDTTTSVTENVSTLTVAAASPKTFATDQAITLTFGGSAVYGTHYGVSPVDADANATGHQVLLPAETASVQVTVTAVDNAAVDGGRTIEVVGSLDGTEFDRTSVAVADNETTTNTAATGKPGISGTAAVGQTLTATTSGISDADGKTNAEDGDTGYAYTYQWILVDGNTETDISGETSSTYTPSSSDVGKTIRVKVSFTDDADKAEGPFTSDQTAPVIEVAAAGICGRTLAVRAAILNKISSVSDCADVTDTHLADVTGGLSLSNRNVTALAVGDFAGLDALTRLNLHDNALTTLPAGVFGGLDALTRLNLHDNALTTLPAGVFGGLDALTELKLYNNALTALPAGVFAGLDMLTTLSLSNSGLTTLPAGLFAGLDALTTLSLSDNALTALPAGVFAGLDALTKLRLHNSGLTALPAGVFAGLDMLTTLWLNDNALTALPAGVFAGLDMLTTLWLDDNALTALPDDVFEPLAALTELKLANNPRGPFAPTAEALPDDGTVSDEGGTVTLDGSGSGGAWGTNVTYSWVQSTSTNGVTFDDNTSATTDVVIPALAADTVLIFTLTVTGKGGTSGHRHRHRHRHRDGDRDHHLHRRDAERADAAGRRRHRHHAESDVSLGYDDGLHGAGGQRGRHGDADGDAERQHCDGRHRGRRRHEQAGRGGAESRCRVQHADGDGDGGGRHHEDLLR